VRATIPKPFDPAAYDAAFTLSGDDLADAYYLTGLALPNSSRYRVEGTLKHQGDQFRVEDFHGPVGSSDIAGTVSVSIRDKRLDSGSPQGADSADNAAQSTGLLLPDADLQVNRVRGMDADVTLKSESVISSKIPLRHVQFHLLLDKGVLRIDPLSLTLRPRQIRPWKACWPAVSNCMAAEARCTNLRRAPMGVLGW
jgi:AsmA family protein